MFDEQFILSLFGTGYNPRARVDGQIEFPPNAKRHESSVNGWQAFKLWDSRGIVAINCTEPTEFRNWIERKAAMVLAIEMWKEAWKSSWADTVSRCLGFLELSELMQCYPVPWMEKVGLFRAIDVTPDEVFKAYKPDLSNLFGDGI